MKLAVGFVVLAFAGIADSYDAPNIIMMLADDIGWSDFGYFGYDFVGVTPNIDQLASEGIKLNCVYGGVACTPGRSAFLSGRYPIRHGLQKGAINQAQAKGIPVNNTLISDALKSVGYATGAVGKWHVGCASWDMTPTYRGFDTYMGFMCTGQIDFLEKTQNGYLDLYSGTEEIQDETSLSTDTRSSWLYEAAAEDFIREHAAKGTSQPFFLYFAQQDPHTPLEAPEYFLESEPCASISDETRQVYCGMLRCIDTSVEGIIATLGENGYYDNTLFVFAGDNGGAPKNGGYNYPLRGSKGTLFEGGIRQASFMWGQMLPRDVLGTTYDGQISLTDWFPTFMSIATAGMWHPNYFYELDGVDLFTALYSGGKSPRNETLLNVIDSAGGIRVGDWVYLEGVKDDGWYPQPDARLGALPMRQSNLTQLRGDCVTVSWNNKTKGWEGDGCNYLFNVAEDVDEQYNVADDYPDLVAVMSAKLAAYAAQAVDYNVDTDKQDAAYDQAAATGYWGPWL